MAPSDRPPTQYPNFRVERDRYVTTVTIDRPDAKNACTGDMWVALGAIFREVALLRRARGAADRRGW